MVSGKASLRILIDTNIFIAAESSADALHVNAALATDLYRSATELGHALCIGAGTLEDIDRHKDALHKANRRQQLKRYHVLERVDVPDGFQAKAGYPPKINPQSKVDLTLLLLLDRGAAQWLVTEDQRILPHARADIKELRLEDDELAEYSLQDDDLLVVEGGEPGRCAIWQESLAEGAMVFQKALHRVRPRGGVSPHFVAMVLRNGIDSGRLQERFTGSTIKHLTGEKLKGFMIPLPPVAEQHRIVERVAQLNELCDDLEQRFLAAASMRADLAASISAQATVDVGVIGAGYALEANA